MFLVYITRLIGKLCLSMRANSIKIGLHMNKFKRKLFSSLPSNFMAVLRISKLNLHMNFAKTKTRKISSNKLKSSPTCCCVYSNKTRKFISIFTYAKNFIAILRFSQISRFIFWQKHWISHELWWNLKTVINEL